MSRLFKPTIWFVGVLASTAILSPGQPGCAEQPVVVTAKKFIEDKPSAASKTATLSSGDHGSSGGQPANKSRVVFITAKNCPRCDSELARLNAAGGDFAWLRSGGWRIGEGSENHIQIVDRDAIPDLVRKLEVREFPAVACIENGEIVRSFKSGCTTPLDAWTFDWLAKGINERPAAPVLEAARVESTGSYPLRGNHWSVEGDWNPTRDKVIEHLRGPNHVSYLQATWHIDAWSYEELRSLHDDLHERYGPFDTGASTTDSAPSTTGAIARKYKGG